MPKHWSEIMQCSCGQRFSSPLAEARHRHSFPMLCRKPKPKKSLSTPRETKWTTDLDNKLLELWNDPSNSAGSIAVKLQPFASWPISRNSVLGRVHRLMKADPNIPRRPNPVNRTY